eukprot:CAMPEP_0206462808 /NCGR_PEP_ID=MMETSP0324_2-20121206/26205_1 /ASSEMBLY_ACC=CAM_ASM_000836 /TAXON_ID=2866 /ORGANISM="Crypthecodinium cohnii, Strain Seligo" /LENGTH=164 /DNA_ID=CAMNT_0053935047 /DNA_START=151 /DNA_END=645 /DNA_ORIENTATION=+
MPEQKRVCRPSKDGYMIPVDEEGGEGNEDGGSGSNDKHGKNFGSTSSSSSKAKRGLPACLSCCLSSPTTSKRSMPNELMTMRAVGRGKGDYLMEMGCCCTCCLVLIGLLLVVAGLLLLRFVQVPEELPSRAKEAVRGIPYVGQWVAPYLPAQLPAFLSSPKSSS